MNRSPRITKPRQGFFLCAGVVAIGLLLGARFLRKTRLEAMPPPSPAAGDLVAVKKNLPEPGSYQAVEKLPGAREPNQFAIRTATDPAEALADALRETDPERGQRLIFSVLQTWAAVEPDAAARAALTWPEGNRLQPVLAVLTGAAQRPDDALRLGAFFCHEDPAWAPEHGLALITALSDSGQFSAAVSFALVAGLTVGGEERSKWLTTAFAGWAQREPQLAALAATSDLAEPGMQQEALIAVIARWRRLNPNGPENFLAQLRVSPERTALMVALAATSGR